MYLGIVIVIETMRVLHYEDNLQLRLFHLSKQPYDIFIGPGGYGQILYLWQDFLGEVAIKKLQRKSCLGGCPRFLMDPEYVGLGIEFCFEHNPT